MIWFKINNIFWRCNAWSITTQQSITASLKSHLLYVSVLFCVLGVLLCVWNRPSRAECLLPGFQPQSVCFCYALHTVACRQVQWVWPVMETMFVSYRTHKSGFGQTWVIQSHYCICGRPLKHLKILLWCYAIKIKWTLKCWAN